MPSAVRVRRRLFATAAMLLSAAWSTVDAAAAEGEPFRDAFDGGAELEWNHNRLRNTALRSPARTDERRSELELQLQGKYRGEDVAALVEVKLLGEQEFRADESPRNSDEVALERGETWFHFTRLFDGGIALRLGRQSFAEPRRWWWDDDLDALRLFYAGGPWRADLGIAQTLLPESTAEDFIDPEQERVRRVLGHASWRFSEALTVSAFYLDQHDGSSRPALGDTVEEDREDASDANLRWLGLRAAGDVEIGPDHLFSYWLDGAMVSGRETTFEFGDEVDGELPVEAVTRRRVRGQALDIGAAWSPYWWGKPTLTLSFARGSGDRDPDGQTDSAFRQTGLQDRDEEFRYYGELLRPELSNLSIAGVTLGLSAPARTRYTLGYHRFRQVYRAPFLRAARLDVQPGGEDKDIGSEISLLVEIRTWQDIELDLATATFCAGDAYGDAAGRRARSVFAKLVYKF